MALDPSNDRISSGSDLAKRLKKKPRSSSTIVASRATLRVLPLILGGATHPEREWSVSNKGLVLSAFRASFVTWVALAQDEHFFEARHAAANASMTASLDGDAIQSAIAIAAAVAAEPATRIDYAAKGAGSAAERTAEAASYAYNNARAEAWYALNADLRFMDRTSSGELMRQPLWLEDVRGNSRYHANFPIWAREHFDTFDNSQHVKNGPWGVWLSWYRAILPNGRSKHPKSAFGSKLDTFIAKQTHEFWDRDPDEVTADIAALVGWTWTEPSEHQQQPREPTPVIPNRQSAAVEPELVNERIALPTRPAAHGDTAGEDLSAALRAMRAELDELAAEVEGAGNIDRRAVNMLRAIAKLIPASAPPQDLLFRLAHRQELLVEYGATVSAEWPSVLAAQYHNVSRQFDRTMRQFPKWRDFVRNAADRSHSAEQIKAVRPLTEQLVEALSNKDAAPFVDFAVPQALEELASPLVSSSSEVFDPFQASKDLLIEDVLESVNNTLKLIAEAALTAEIKKYGARVWDGVKAAAETQAPIDGANIFKWARRALLGACGLGIWELLALFPEKFRWLHSIVEFLKAIT